MHRHLQLRVRDTSGGTTGALSARSGFALLRVPGREAAIAAEMPVVVCPSVATRACAFSDDVGCRVESLADVTLSKLFGLREPS